MEPSRRGGERRPLNEVSRCFPMTDPIGKEEEK
jgi:hypothetical protein